LKNKNIVDSGTSNGMNTLLLKELSTSHKTGAVSGSAIFRSDKMIRKHEKEMTYPFNEYIFVVE
jgi:hypothetical protein